MRVQVILQKKTARKERSLKERTILHVNYANLGFFLPCPPALPKLPALPLPDIWLGKSGFIPVLAECSEVAGATAGSGIMDGASS